MGFMPVLVETSKVLISYLMMSLDIAFYFFFLVLVQEDYHNQNPYHNAVHAADVTQAMHCYLKEPKVRRSTAVYYSTVHKVGDTYAV